MSGPTGPLDETERVARLRLARTDRVGPVSFRQLLDRCGTAVRALDALPDLARRAGSAGYDLPPIERIEAELAAGEARGATLVVLGDAGYPERLAAVDPPPPVLWTRGDVGLLSRETIAMVGTRIASAGGQRIARGLAQSLGQDGFVVVSAWREASTQRRMPDR